MNNQTNRCGKTANLRFAKVCIYPNACAVLKNLMIPINNNQGMTVLTIWLSCYIFSRARIATHEVEKSGLSYIKVNETICCPGFYRQQKGICENCPEFTYGLNCSNKCRCLASEKCNQTTGECKRCNENPADTRCAEHTINGSPETRTESSSIFTIASYTRFFNRQKGQLNHQQIPNNSLQSGDISTSVVAVLVIIPLLVLIIILVLLVKRYHGRYNFKKRGTTESVHKLMSESSHTMKLMNESHELTQVNISEEILRGGSYKDVDGNRVYISMYNAMNVDVRHEDSDMERKSKDLQYISMHLQYLTESMRQSVPNDHETKILTSLHGELSNVYIVKRGIYYFKGFRGIIHACDASYHKHILYLYPGTVKLEKHSVNVNVSGVLQTGAGFQKCIRATGECRKCLEKPCEDDDDKSTVSTKDYSTTPRPQSTGNTSASSTVISATDAEHGIKYNITTVYPCDICEQYGNCSYEPGCAVSAGRGTNHRKQKQKIKESVLVKFSSSDETTEYVDPEPVYSEIKEEEIGQRNGNCYKPNLPDRPVNNEYYKLPEADENIETDECGYLNPYTALRFARSESNLFRDRDLRDKGTYDATYSLAKAIQRDDNSSPEDHGDLDKLINDSSEKDERSSDVPVYFVLEKNAKQTESHENPEREKLLKESQNQGRAFNSENTLLCAIFIVKIVVFMSICCCFKF
ncbi:MEGF10_11 [Mytilus edulis]|uniref:MEGF10_11 n=1 Tax=Mytilus edulis TaxID=6550 RepID=A0A8S3V876_MYTED|nr:MEGF10_11 [Mytilus edulis]